MAINNALPTNLPIPQDSPGLGFATKQWMPQVRGFQNAEAQVALSQTASFTVGLSFFYPCDATAGAVVATLPLAATQWNKKYLLKKIDSSANIITVTPSGSDKIDGKSTYVLSSQYSSLYIVSDGVSNWWIIEAFPGAGFVGNPTVITSGFGTFTTSGTTTLIKLILNAAGGPGGAGNTVSAKGGGGGGSGEYGEWIVPVAASTGYAYSIGAAGSNTTFTVGSVVYTSAFGVAGVAGTGTGAGGAGGGRSGPAGGASGAPGAAGSAAVNEGEVGEYGSESGASGGGSGAASTDAGGAGGPSGSFSGGAGGGAAAVNSASGGGGAASRFGPGGTGATGAALGVNGSNAFSTAYGAGGGGGGGSSTGGGTGGTGAGGIIIIIPLN